MNEKEIIKQKAGDTMSDTKESFLFARKVYNNPPDPDAPVVGTIKDSGVEKRLYEKRDDGKFYCSVAGCSNNTEPLDSYEKFKEHFIDMHGTKTMRSHMIGRQRSLMRSKMRMRGIQLEYNEEPEVGEFYYRPEMRRILYTDENLRQYSICPFDSCSEKIPFRMRDGREEPDMDAEQKHLEEHAKLFEAHDNPYANKRRRRMIDMQRLYNFNKDKMNEIRAERLMAGKHGGTRFGEEQRTKEKRLQSYYEDLVERGWEKLASSGEN